MSETEKPNYYAIIPANVRYDKNLTMAARMLYGEITALCNEKGYCWASNEYFAKLYDVSKKSISVWVSSLEQNGYVSVEMVYKEGSKEIVNRYIRLCVYPMEVNVNTPMEVNVKDNTTLINTTLNNTFNNNTPEVPAKKTVDKPYSQEFENFWDIYPKREGKKQAYKVFNTLLKKDVTQAMIHERLKTYKARIQSLNTMYEYIRNPATFLNNLDDYASGFVPTRNACYSKPELKVNQRTTMLDLEE